MNNTIRIAVARLFSSLAATTVEATESLAVRSAGLSLPKLEIPLPEPSKTAQWPAITATDHVLSAL